jgi:hypothetical protein
MAETAIVLDAELRKKLGKLAAAYYSCGCGKPQCGDCATYQAAFNELPRQVREEWLEVEARFRNLSTVSLWAM